METQKALILVCSVCALALTGVLLTGQYPVQSGVSRTSSSPQTVSGPPFLHSSSVLRYYAAKKGMLLQDASLKLSPKPGIKKSSLPPKKVSRPKRRRWRVRKRNAAVVSYKRAVKASHGRASAHRQPRPAIQRQVAKDLSGVHIKPATAHAAWKKLQKEPLFLWPVDPSQFWISSRFGPRKKPNGKWALHAGLDMAAVRGTPVWAAADGIVVAATRSAGYGKYIMIRHNDQAKTRYAHLDKILVNIGQRICVGDKIGRVGATGLVRKSKRGGSGSHLHFEVYMGGKPVNPFYFLA